jgi:hypothetical protein
MRLYCAHILVELEQRITQEPRPEGRRMNIEQLATTWKRGRGS